MSVSAIRCRSVSGCERISVCCSAIRERRCRARHQQHRRGVLSARTGRWPCERKECRYHQGITSPDGKKVWAIGTDYLRKAFFLSTYGIYRTQIISDGWTGRAWNEETEAYDGDYHASLSASIAKRKAFYGNLYGCNIYRTDSW